MQACRWATRAVCAVALPGWSIAGAQQAPRGELADLSLEELANLQVTSVSRRAELAPNLQVARISCTPSAISARR